MLAAGLCYMLASPAFAQAPAPAACEMHVWPAPELKAVTQGWVWNHTVDQAFDPSKGGVARPKVLEPEAQAALLATIDLAELFRAAPAQVVIHPEPLSRAQALSPARQSPSASPCYSELIVRQIFYDYAPMAGKSLRTLFVYRRFGDAPEVRSSFSTFGETSLATFPAATAAEAKAAETELQMAYRANVHVFARYEQAPHEPAKKPKGK
jgi:hypothetical protein